MSRIGKQPVVIPAGVTITLNGQDLNVKGKLGELKLKIHPRIKIDITDQEVLVKRQSEERFDRSLHGLFRSLIQNLVIGVHEGYEKKLEVIGVGYRAQVSGNKLTMSLGFSHPIEVMAPENIQFEIDKQTKNTIIVKGIDKQVVGEISAKIRSYRKPEPYKGKGIRYVGEYIFRKAGKTATKAK